MQAGCQESEPSVMRAAPPPLPAVSQRTRHSRTSCCCGVDWLVSTRATSFSMPMITPAVLASSCTRSCSSYLPPSVSTPARRECERQEGCERCTADQMCEAMREPTTLPRAHPSPRSSAAAARHTCAAVHRFREVPHKQAQLALPRVRHQDGHAVLHLDHHARLAGVRSRQHAHVVAGLRARAVSQGGCAAAAAAVASRNWRAGQGRQQHWGAAAAAACKRAGTR